MILKALLLPFKIALSLAAFLIGILLTFWAVIIIAAVVLCLI